jgi:phage protein D
MSMPAIAIQIAGAPLAQALQDNLSSLEIVDSLDAVAAISLELLVPPSTERSTILALAKPGSLVSITLTPPATAGGTPMTWEGDLIEVQHRDGVGRAYTVRMRVLDRLHRLRGKPRTKVWEGAHDKIVSTIAGEHGFTGRAEAVEATTDYTFQANVSDAVFLRQLAARYNYSVRLEGKTLVFARRDVAAGQALTLTWGTDIVDLQLTQSLEGLATDVTALAWSTVTHLPLRATMGATAVRNISQGTTGLSLVQTAFGTVWIRLDNLPVQNLSEAYAAASTELRTRAERYVRGRIVTRGQAAAYAGRPVTLALCPGFEGTYLIHEVHHTWEPGSAFRTAIGFYSDGMPAAAA